MWVLLQNIPLSLSFDYQILLLLNRHERQARHVSSCAVSHASLCLSKADLLGSWMCSSSSLRTLNKSLQPWKCEAVYKPRSHTQHAYVCFMQCSHYWLQIVSPVAETINCKWNLALLLSPPPLSRQRQKEHSERKSWDKAYWVCHFICN